MLYSFAAESRQMDETIEENGKNIELQVTEGKDGPMKVSTGSEKPQLGR